MNRNQVYSSLLIGRSGTKGVVTLLIGLLFFFQLEISAFHTHHTTCSISHGCHLSQEQNENDTESNAENTEHSCPVCLFKATMHHVVVSEPFNLSTILLTPFYYYLSGDLLTLSYLTYFQPLRAPPYPA